MSDSRAFTNVNTRKPPVEDRDSSFTPPAFISRRAYGIQTGLRGAALKRAHNLYRKQRIKEKGGILACLIGTRRDYGIKTGLEGEALVCAWDHYLSERINEMGGTPPSYTTRRDYGIKTGLKSAALKHTHDCYRHDRSRKMAAYLAKLLVHPKPSEIKKEKGQPTTQRVRQKAETKKLAGRSRAVSTRFTGYPSIKPARQPKKPKRAWIRFVQGGAPALGKRA
jgi:hypothetical protein